MARDNKLYRLLAISPTATSQEIRAAYKKQALKWHPDKNHGDPKAEEKFKEIRHAFEILSDPVSRREYDFRGFESTPRTTHWETPRRPTTMPPRPTPRPTYGLFPEASGSTEDDDFMFKDDEYIRELFETVRKNYAAETKRTTRLLKQRRRGGSGCGDEEDYFPPAGLVIFRLLFDLAINVSAGAAAAAAGAHANGNPVTSHVTQIGALAGLAKSAIAGLAWCIGLRESTSLAVLRRLLGSGIVICLLVAVGVSSVVLGEIPTPVIVAALVSGMLLDPECRNHNGSSEVEGLAIFYCCVPCFCCCTLAPGSGAFMLVPLDALGGLVFAAITSRMGLKVCAPHAAAAAGAVFGTISCIPPAVDSILRFCFILGSSLQDAEDVEASRPLL